eukprot:627454-Lingulodinium_polyedra.AAC.1
MRLLAGCRARPTSAYAEPAASKQTPICAAEGGAAGAARRAEGTLAKPMWSSMASECKTGPR